MSGSHAKRDSLFGDSGGVWLPNILGECWICKGLWYLRSLFCVCTSLSIVSPLSERRANIVIGLLWFAVCVSWVSSFFVEDLRLLCFLKDFLVLLINLETIWYSSNISRFSKSVSKLRLTWSSDAISYRIWISRTSNSSLFSVYAIYPSIESANELQAIITFVINSASTLLHLRLRFNYNRIVCKTVLSPNSAFKIYFYWWLRSFDCLEMSMLDRSDTAFYKNLKSSLLFITE